MFKIRKDTRRAFSCLLNLLFLVLLPQAAAAQESRPKDGSPFQWGAPIRINDVPQFEDQGKDARGLNPGKFGSEFPRLLKTSDQSWLAVYTIYRNMGYLKSATGGTELQIAKSEDNGTTWRVLSTLSDPGRDLDNGQLVQLEDGSLILAFRSVIWKTSYRIQTAKSSDDGETWAFQSTIDANEGSSGALGNPNRGIYEPYMLRLDDDHLAVMYASEKYAKSSPAFSQVISMKISTDDGYTWGEETFPVKDRNDPRARPGMPVWTRMGNGSYALVYEMCGTDDCKVWFKTSADGRNWGDSLGKRIPLQLAAPFIASLDDGRLIVTSNSHELSISRDFGATWYLNDTNPWQSFAAERNKWPSIYQFDEKKVAVVTSKSRNVGGANIHLRFGSFEETDRSVIEDGKAYTFTVLHSGQNLDVSAGSTANGTVMQQWPGNGLNPQKWLLTRNPDGSYKIRSAQSGKLLEVEKEKKEPGARVQQWQDTGCVCQDWYLEYLGSGSYRVRAKHSGLYLDVAGGSMEAGAKLHQWHQNGARPQTWRIRLAR